MNDAEHENYAKKLLSSISDDQPERGGITFTPNRTQSRNAAHAMTAILCHRLFKKSGEQPKRIRSSTYAWKEGVLNNRNIADRDYLWSNMRRRVAEEIHQDARKRPVAYLLAFSSPSNTNLSIWAIPEPLLFDSLSRLPVKAGGQEYTIQISANKQRIAHDPESPEFSSYFAEFPLSQHELRVLTESRDIDALVTSERAIATEQDGDATPEIDSTDVVEGRALLRLHRLKERKPWIIRRKKRVVLAETGRLLCEVCEFDFASVYGKVGEGFAECHHCVPLSALDGETPTRLADLAVVCANCHRMLHRSRPMVSVEDLRRLVAWRRSEAIRADQDAQGKHQ